MQTASLQQAGPSGEPNEVAVSACSSSAARKFLDDNSLSAIVPLLSDNSTYNGRKAQSSLTSYHRLGFKTSYLQKSISADMMF